MKETVIMDNATEPTAHPPWYRQFWPWFLIALPLSAVLAGIVTLYLAAAAPDPVIKNDRYEKLGPVIVDSPAKPESADR